jgi:hypothetical protein
MAFGPGKYDDLCSLVRDKAQAMGVLVIVLGGEKGNGFSCQADLATTLMLPDLLRTVADQIEKGGIG